MKTSDKLGFKGNHDTYDYVIIWALQGITPGDDLDNSILHTSPKQAAPPRAPHWAVTRAVLVVCGGEKFPQGDISDDIWSIQHVMD